MKKGKKIVIGVAAVAVVAGGFYAVSGGSRRSAGRMLSAQRLAVFTQYQEEAAARHSFLRFRLQRRRPEMWKKLWMQPERWSVMNRKLFIHR